MAKVSIVEREKRRMHLVEKYRKRRDELRKMIKDPKVSREEKAEAILAMQKLPVNSSPSRLRNRCHLTGRPRGYYRKFGLARNKLREHAMNGDVPGLIKASW